MYFITLRISSRVFTLFLCVSFNRTELQYSNVSSFSNYISIVVQMKLQYTQIICDEVFSYTISSHLLCYSLSSICLAQTYINLHTYTLYVNAMFFFFIFCNSVLFTLIYTVFVFICSNTMLWHLTIHWTIEMQ